MKIAQTNQNEMEREPRIGHERGHSSLAGMVMKTCCSLAALLAVLSLGAIAGQVAGPTFLTNGDLTISYTGTPGNQYAAEWADSLIPPVTWTPLLTNTADSNGLVSFTNTPAGSQTFYRVHDVTTMIPLVYAVENTGTNCAPPPLPIFGPFVPFLPDPFMWADGSGRSTNFADWKCRRAEITAQIENYEIGPKPAVDIPSQITASYSGGTTAGSSGTLTVYVTVGTNTLTLTSPIIIPSGAIAPYPVCIGMDSPYGALNASDFTSRGIAGVIYSESQVSPYGNPQNTDPYHTLYGPGLNVDNTGQYSAWAWGVSRIIDGLTLVTNTLPIDLNHICVTGCSYAGKLALFAGAFDERVALTVAQESGGGGATSWRYSHSDPSNVEDIDNTDYNWFANQMQQFSGANVSYLPEDHHELMAMCAPRALFVTANPDYSWLSNPSCYVCSRAVQQIYNTLGIPDRFGFSIVGGHSHCAFPSSQDSELGYFLDKFMLGQTNLSTIVATYPTNYTSINYARWYARWGN
ncbi:MAG: hypothetical protein ABSE97_03180 [Verrucomicrobiota bacterium]|jgi:hypothetical protein